MRKGVFLGFCILLVAGIASAVYWPQLALLIAKPAPNTQVQNDKPEQPGSVAVVTPKDPAPPKQVPQEPPVKPPVKPPEPKQNEPPIKPSEPVKPPVKPSEPMKPPVKPPNLVKPPEPPPQAVVFPRRALAVSVNNYLYANPVGYGPAARGGRNVQTLLERLNSGLRFPTDQMALLSDAASGNPRPPLKPVIEKAVNDFLTTAREQDRILVLFIGHAVEIEDEPYLVPLEGDLEDKRTLLPLKWLYERLAGCRARQKVLVLDVCRTNPSRGQERPGGGPMGAKLDALLKMPPPGVQVWSSCLAQQHSYESEGGVFLDALTDVVTQGLPGSTQKPDDLIPVARLAELVNQRMKDVLDKEQKVQTSRVSGEEPQAGAMYDGSQPRPPTVAIEVPQPEGGAANLDVVRAILKDVQVPPVKSTRDDQPLRAEAMPLFAAKALEAYKDDGEKTPFRGAVVRGRDALNKLSGKRLREDFRAPANETRFKDEIKDYQMREVAVLIGDLSEVLEDLKAAGKEREKETSKRWQANNDYVLARLQMQVAYLYEYTTLLGSMRKDLPTRDPKIHGGWRLASQAALNGDAAGKKLATDAKKLLDKLAKDHPDTPWEVLAKRERYTALGLDWLPVK